MVPKEVGQFDAGKKLSEWFDEWDLVAWQKEYLTTYHQVPKATYTLSDLEAINKSYQPKYVQSWGFEVGQAGPPKPKPHQCPICLKRRHSAPLTRSLYYALESHRLEDYDWRNDESEILCPWPGEGPVRDFNQRGYYQPVYGASWILPKFEFDPEPWEKLLKAIEGPTAHVGLWTSDWQEIKPGKVGPTKDPETQIDVEYKAIEKPKIQPKELEAAKETLTDVEWDGGIELPDMKADYDSLAETVNKKTYHYVIKEKK